MPLVVRQALASRLSALPELRAFLDDMSLLAGAPVRFWPSVAGGERGAGDAAPASPGLCLRMAREPEGCRMCVSFRHKLREQAANAPAEAACDAGLFELLVPVPVGGVVAGHFLVAGLREDANPAREANRARHLLARHGVRWPAEDLARLRATMPECDARRRAALGRVLQAGAEKIGRAMTEHLTAPTPGVPALVERTYRLVHADYARPLRVPSLARRLEVSAAHLSRVFHQTTGLRLVDYIARYRAGQARTMLLEDDGRSVREIAHASGFASVSQFNRVFSATFGTNPRSLRRDQAAA